MTRRPIKNLADSVRARLLTLSRERGEDFQLVQGAGILRQPPVGRQRLVEEL